MDLYDGGGCHNHERDGESKQDTDPPPVRQHGMDPEKEEAAADHRYNCRSPPGAKHCNSGLAGAWLRVSPYERKHFNRACDRCGSPVVLQATSRDPSNGDTLGNFVQRQSKWSREARDMQRCQCSHAPPVQKAMRCSRDEYRPDG